MHSNTSHTQLARRRPLPASDPLFEAGNMDRELKARESAPKMSQQGEKMLMRELEADATGTRSSQQKCSICLSVLPTSFLLSVHVSEQHDSFFASQAAQRMPVFQCLVEGCNSSFCSAVQRHQHLTDLHQIPATCGFDRIHLTAHHGQVRPESGHRLTTDDSLQQSAPFQALDMMHDTEVTGQEVPTSMTTDVSNQSAEEQHSGGQSAELGAVMSAAVHHQSTAEASGTQPDANLLLASGRTQHSSQAAHHCESAGLSPVPCEQPSGQPSGQPCMEQLGTSADAGLPDRAAAAPPAASSRACGKAPLGGAPIRGHGRGRGRGRHRISLT